MKSFRSIKWDKKKKNPFHVENGFQRESLFQRDFSPNEIPHEIH